MALFNHTPEDRRSALYGRPCQEKDIDPRGKITIGAHWFGSSHLPSGTTPTQRSYKHNPDTVYHRKQVLEIATGRIFDSLTDAAKELCISQSAMSHRVRAEKEYKFLDKTAPTNRAIKNLQTGQVYASITDAEQKTGLSIDQIRRHCQGRTSVKKFEYVAHAEPVKVNPFAGKFEGRIHAR
jgi:hypothetical protein